MTQKGSLLLIVLFLGLLTILGSSTYFYFNKDKFRGSENIAIQESPLPVTSPVQNIQEEIANFKYVNFNNQNINTNSEIIFSDENIIYKAKLDSSKITKWLSMENKITGLKFLPDKETLFIQTSASNQIDPVNHAEDGVENWVLKVGSNTPQKLTIKKPYSSVTNLYTYVDDLVRPEWISVMVGNPETKADIQVDKFDGKNYSNLISFSKPLLHLSACDGESCQDEDIYPDQFISSFDGGYLLSKPSIKGGLGEPAVVISRDGSKIYKIDFYWYVAWAIWIDNNKLLAQDQSGTKLYTFLDNGQFTKSDIIGLENVFARQIYLSPSRNILAGKETEGIGLFDTSNFTKKLLPQTENLEIISWNKEGSLLLLHTKNSPKEIKIYSLKEDKIYSIADFKDIPNWVATNRDGFGNSLVDII